VKVGSATSTLGAVFPEGHAGLPGAVDTTIAAPAAWASLTWSMFRGTYDASMGEQ
jgi:hypothetical protein